MRAEMTVGLDLKSLENLRIVNGYGEVKKERKSSFEGPSSPEESAGKYESDSSQQDVSSSSSITTKTKPRCGRPANPIPRHKRDSHIKAEYKRRDKIQKGFDTLMSLVPELVESTSGKESRSSMLFKTAEYCRRLKSECGGAQTEIAALRQELEALGSEIHDLQEQLPQHGSQHVEEREVSMDSLYNQYIAEETKKDWKFWVFGFFMRPLYDSYKETMADSQKPEQFNHRLLEWVQDRLSLKNLRKGFLNSLRYISKHTGIMTAPENLQQEAQTRVTDHFLATQFEPVLAAQYDAINLSTQSATQQRAAVSPRVTTPVGTPRVVTPVPGTPRSHTSVPGTPKGCTPIQTPTASPPRTPVVGRRSLKRDSVRSTESRSRSNSSESAETKTKRKSSYRSRSGKRSPGGSASDIENNRSYVKSTQPAQLPFNTYMASQTQQELQTPVTMTTDTSSTQCVLTDKQIETTMASLDDKVMTTFVESLINAMKPHSAVPTFDSLVSMAPSSSASTSVSSSAQNSHISNKHGHIGYPTNTQKRFIPLQHTPTSTVSVTEATSVASQNNEGRHSSSFVPLEKSSMITGGVVMNVDESTNSAQSFQDTLFTDILSMDTSDYSNHVSLTEMPSYNENAPMPMSQTENTMYQNLSGSTDMCGSVSVTELTECKQENHLMNTDDDSLMNFLKVDVMDMGTVMEFLKPDEAHS